MRDHAGLSLRALAGLSGLSAAFLGKVENGRKAASPRALAAYELLEGFDGTLDLAEWAEALAGLEAE